jgi:DNA-binding Lrp family transcriptional regulator
MSVGNGALDEKGMNLLRMLHEDSGIAQKTLAHKLGISPSKVSERITKLVADGYIKKFTVDIDYDVLGYDSVGFFIISLKEKDEELVKEINEFLILHPKVTEVYEMFGSSTDYIVKIMCTSNEEIRDVGKEILSLPKVQSGDSFTHLVAKRIKNDRGVTF